MADKELNTYNKVEIITGRKPVLISYQEALSLYMERKQEIENTAKSLLQKLTDIASFSINRPGSFLENSPIDNIDSIVESLRKAEIKYKNNAMPDIKYWEE